MDGLNHNATVLKKKSDNRKGKQSNVEFFLFVLQGRTQSNDLL